MAALFSVFVDFIAEVDEVRDCGDAMLVAARVRGHGIGSDVPFEATVWQVLEFRHEKVIRWRHFQNEAEALEAAGLRE